MLKPRPNLKKEYENILNNYHKDSGWTTMLNQCKFSVKFMCQCQKTRGLSSMSHSLFNFFCLNAVMYILDKCKFKRKWISTEKNIHSSNWNRQKRLNNNFNLIISGIRQGRIHCVATFLKWFVVVEQMIKHNGCVFSVMYLLDTI